MFALRHIHIEFSEAIRRQVYHFQALVLEVVALNLADLILVQLDLLEIYQIAEIRAASQFVWRQWQDSEVGKGADGRREVFQSVATHFENS